MERKPGENALKKLHTRSSITFKPQNVFRSTLFIFFSNIPCLLSVLNFKAFVVECECGTQRRELKRLVVVVRGRSGEVAGGRGERRVPAAAAAGPLTPMYTSTALLEPSQKARKLWNLKQFPFLSVTERLVCSNDHTTPLCIYDAPQSACSITSSICLYSWMYINNPQYSPYPLKGIFHCAQYFLGKRSDYLVLNNLFELLPSNTKASLISWIKHRFFRTESKSQW